MDLWIRSQDRESLMKVNRVDKYGLSIVTFDNEFREIYLGRYATEERALEVLDNIHKVLKGDIENHINKFDLYIDNNRIVYEMPKE